MAIVLAMVVTAIPVSPANAIADAVLLAVARGFAVVVAVEHYLVARLALLAEADLVVAQL